MRTNIEIDDALMREALLASEIKTKKAAVEEGLRFIGEESCSGRILSLIGKVDWDESYDHKGMRGSDKWNGSSLTWETDASLPEPVIYLARRQTRKKAA